MPDADVIWCSRCPVPTATGIAIRRGMLDQALGGSGVQVRSLAASTDRSVRQSHFDQSQRLLFRHGGNGPPLMSLSRGTRIKIVGLSWHDVYRPILAMTGAGIVDATGLKGRRLSLPVRASDPFDFWRAAVLRGYSDVLASAGLSLADVDLVEVPTDRAFVDDTADADGPRGSLFGANFMLGHQREEAFALIRGEVDAIYSHGSIAVIVQGFTGAKAIADIGALRVDGAERPANNDCPLVFTATTDLVEQMPDVVAALLREAMGAAGWARDHKDEACRLVAADVGIAEELTTKAYSPEFHRQLDIDLSKPRLAALDRQIAALSDAGFLAGPIDLAEVIDPGPLRQAKASAACEKAPA